MIVGKIAVESARMGMKVNTDKMEVQLIAKTKKQMSIDIRGITLTQNCVIRQKVRKTA